MNTWCNQRHNVPYVFPLTSQSDPFIPSIPTLNFPAPVLGTSVVSFTGMELHAPPQYIQQWSASVEKQFGPDTTFELGYLGSGGFHLQRSHLINNAQPGPGLIQPRRPHPKSAFVDNTSSLRRHRSPLRYDNLRPSAPSTCSKTPPRAGMTPATSTSAAATPKD